MQIGFLLFFISSALFALPAEAFREVSSEEVRRARPGDVLRVLPLSGGAPNGAKAYRMLYRSTGAKGEPVLVSGAIFFSDRPVVEGAERPVVAWAHPTTGVSSSCSPTLRTDFFNKIPGIEEMLREGYVVVATDYVGLGTRGPHPYLVGDSQARAVLDSVRAARRLSHARASSRFIAWGHSQGGHAALFTGELAPTYAPELELVGVAAAAPATNLAELFRDDVGSVWGNTLTAMALFSWSKVYKLNADDLIHDDARSAFRRVANDCLESLGDVLRILQDEKPLETRFLKRDPTEIPVWRSIMDENSPGRRRIAAPIFIAQGLRDKIVPHAVTRQFALQSCQRGTRVTYMEMTSIAHMNAATHSARRTINWMKYRFTNKNVGDSCPS